MPYSLLRPVVGSRDTCLEGGGLVVPPLGVKEGAVLGDDLGDSGVVRPKGLQAKAESAVEEGCGLAEAVLGAENDTQADEGVGDVGVLRAQGRLEGGNGARPGRRRFPKWPGCGAGGALRAPVAPGGCGGWPGC